MSSTVSATTSSSSAAPTSQCAALLYDTPGHDSDIVCAVPYTSEYIGFMEDCCKGADVFSYYNNCGLGCLVVDQTVDDFKSCMKGKKVPDQFPFCSGKNSTTDKATGTKVDLPASLTASIIGGSSSTSSTGTNTASSATGTSTSGSSSSSSDKGAAASFGVSKMAVAVGALLLGTFIVA
ncbi:unnamed protein product [Clonostachys rosea]|uniref:Extracellular membrane protein CFEM domain-containing protein n=1 Tax=Bionectria ochroleuca TaxID=29856 RepID=A0ABY6U3I5_BIOOC|nr:unnamed protein product [Clonostachys rosea]